MAFNFSSRTNNSFWVSLISLRISRRFLRSISCRRGKPRTPDPALPNLPLRSSMTPPRYGQALRASMDFQNSWTLFRLVTAGLLRETLRDGYGLGRGAEKGKMLSNFSKGVRTVRLSFQRRYESCLTHAPQRMPTGLATCLPHPERQSRNVFLRLFG